MAFVRKHIFRPEHPLAPPSGLILVSRVVLYDKIGPGVHPCNWCGVKLTWAGAGSGSRVSGKIVADHCDNDPENDDPGNLVVACYGCNISRGRTPMAQGEVLFMVIGGIRHRAVEKVCERCKSTFLMPRSQLKYRSGRFCGRACRNVVVTAASARGIRPEEITVLVPGTDGRRKRVRAVERPCEWCRRVFRVPARRKGRFCGGSCAARYRERQKGGQGG